MFRCPQVFYLLLVPLLLNAICFSEALMVTVNAWETECIYVEIFSWQEEIDVSYEVFGGGSMKVEVLLACLCRM